MLQIITRIEDNIRRIGESEVELGEGEGAEAALEKSWDHYLLFT